VRQLSNRQVVWKIKGLSANVVAVHYGAGFAGQLLNIWAYAHSMRLGFIEPGNQAQNTHVDSFNSKFRDEWQEVNQACEQA